MSFSIDQFKSELSGGLALSNLYSVELPRIHLRSNTKGSVIPVFASTETANRLNLFCKEVNLPGRQIFTNERQIGMKSVKQAYSYEQDDVSMTFYVPNNHRVKDYFEAWQSLIVNPGVTNSLTFPNEYCYDIIIRQFSKDYVYKDFDESFNLFDLVELNIDNPLDTILNAANAQRSVQLIDAFPTSMAQQTLSGDNSNVLELNIQLSYKNWRTL